MQAHIKTNMCKAVDKEGIAVKATYCSRVCVGGLYFIEHFLTA